ncbi:unnamed protein product [Rhizophagus irregularis]|nr:unnamed protein product [Rhizophagus irregularis]
MSTISCASYINDYSPYISFLSKKKNEYHLYLLFPPFTSFYQFFILSVASDHFYISYFSFTYTTSQLLLYGQISIKTEEIFEKKSGSRHILIKHKRKISLL